METDAAFAKVNLSLRVVGVRHDGYHLLESLVVFAGIGDVLTASPAPALSLNVTGPKSAGVPSDDSNLVLRAARRLQDLRGVTMGAALTLEKHLPHGGGIGGGSADAAAAIRLLARLWQVAPLTAAEALPLGADIPVCLRSPAPTLMRGIGDDLVAAPDLPPGWLVLVNPGVHLSTPAVFRAFDRLYHPSPLGLEPFLTRKVSISRDDLALWLSAQSNDLTRIAAEEGFAPVVVKSILPRLRAASGCMDCDMSGSGSTCWGWFDHEHEARAAALQIGADFPDWWVVAAPILRPADQAGWSS